MANKRDKGKPGSIRTRGKWGSDDEGVTFNTMCAQLEGIVDPARRHCQKPMKQRKAELLAKIQKKGPSGWGTNSINFFEPVLGKLIKDGDVVLKRVIYRSGWNGANRTAMVATWFPEVVEEQVSEPNAKKNAALKEAGMRVPGATQGQERTTTEVIIWNKKKNDQLLFDIMTGKADPAVVKEVQRTKTKFRKMKILPAEEKEDD